VPHVITEPCIDVKDGGCVVVCPVDCIYEGARMLYIQPDECINCGLCVSICPVDAIYADDRLPASQVRFQAVNAEFFGPAVTGLGAPGGASTYHSPTRDHPDVVMHPVNAKK
jgi:NAD-dependent dihydropyrimidine dehydrogenase PreA subunit